jgi:hypothetical protein
MEPLDRLLLVLAFGTAALTVVITGCSEQQHHCCTATLELTMTSCQLHWAQLGQLSPDMYGQEGRLGGDARLTILACPWTYCISGTLV